MFEKKSVQQTASLRALSGRLASDAPAKLSNLRWGCIDRTGAWMIEPRFEECHGFYPDICGFARDLGTAASDGKFGFVDRVGRWVIEPQYDFAREYNHGVACVEQRGRRWFIDRRGKPAGCSRHKIADVAFYDGVAPVEEDGFWGFVDRHGDWRILPQYDHAQNFVRGRAQVTIAGKSRWIDLHGRTIFEIPYVKVGVLSEGLVRVYVDGRYGFVDKRGAWVVTPRWPKLGAMSDGLARVNIEDKLCFIDRTGQVALRTPYDYHGNPGKFRDGFFQLNNFHRDGRRGLMDKRGNLLFCRGCEIESHFIDGLAIVREERCGRYGYINRRGEMVIKPRFAEVGCFHADKWACAAIEV